VPSIVIRDVPEVLHRMLKDRARRNHRSLTKEVVAILEESLGGKRRALPPPVPLKRPLTEEVVEEGRREGRA